MYAAVEECEVVLVRIAFADPVEHLKQGRIPLSKDLAELDQRRAGALAERAQAEEERAAVLGFQVLGNVRFVDDGGQLVQVPEEGEANAAEGLARPPAIDAQGLIDGPHEI